MLTQYIGTEMFLGRKQEVHHVGIEPDLAFPGSRRIRVDGANLPPPIKVSDELINSFDGNLRGLVLILDHLRQEDTVRYSDARAAGAGIRLGTGTYP